MTEALIQLLWVAAHFHARAQARAGLRPDWALVHRLGIQLGNPPDPYTGPR